MHRHLRVRPRYAVAGAGFRGFVVAGVGWVDGPCRRRAAAVETMVHGDVAVTAARLGAGQILEDHVTLERLASTAVLLYRALKKLKKQTQTTTTTTTKLTTTTTDPAGSVINLLIKTYKTLGMDHS